MDGPTDTNGYKSIPALEVNYPRYHVLGTPLYGGDSETKNVVGTDTDTYGDKNVKSGTHARG